MSVKRIDPHRILSNGKTVHIRGWQPDDGKDLHRDFRLAEPEMARALPTSVTKLATCPPVFDQGSIGSCTANAGAEIYEHLEPRGEGKIFSRAFGYAETRIEEGSFPEDSGCQVRDVLKGMAKRGLCFEETFPYDPDVCDAEPTPAALSEALQHKARVYYRCPTLRSIKWSLATGFAVIFGFQVYESMMTPEVASSGLVPYPAPDDNLDGGHCVVAVGYDDNMQIGAEAHGVPSRGAFFCQNSWGTGWGAGGFFWLPYRYWTDRLASDCWTLRSAAV